MYRHECCGDCRHCCGDYCAAKEITVNPNGKPCPDFEER